MGLRTGRAAGLDTGLLAPMPGRRAGRAIGDGAADKGRRLDVGPVPPAGLPAALLAACIPPGVYGYLLPLTVGMIKPPLM